MMGILHRPSSATAPDALVRRMMQNAHLRDGLPEILLGFIFLLFAAQQYVMVQWQRSGVRALYILATIMILIWVGLILSSDRLLTWVRGRYLISRCGYMKPKINRRGMVLAGGVAVLIVAAFVFAMWTFPLPVVYRWLERWFPAAMGALLGVLEPAMGRSPRFLVMGALTLACGVLLSFSYLVLDLRLAVFFGFAGGMAMISGTIVLAHFLRTSVNG